MGSSFIGRIIDQELVKELESLGIDPCGENGEYHTLVLDCPLFEERLDVFVHDKILHEQYWFANLELQ
jgi:diphthamide synthase (EF-2-diphthine--ammonia ligase)